MGGLRVVFLSVKSDGARFAFAWTVVHRYNCTSFVRLKVEKRKPTVHNKQRPHTVCLTREKSDGARDRFWVVRRRSPKRKEIPQKSRKVSFLGQRPDCFQTVHILKRD